MGKGRSRAYIKGGAGLKEKRKISTQHGAIFDYWKEKYINKDGSIVLERYAGKDSIPVVKDEGEPMCWACSKPFITEYEDKISNPPTDEEIHRLWMDKVVKSGLNRCHIVPDAMGGEDTPQNLFLLCGNCHIDSPDTMNREGFFRWVYRRRASSAMGVINPAEMISDIEVELEDRGLPKILEMEKEKPGFFYDGDFKKFLSTHIGTHGAKVVMSTYIVAIADYIEECYKTAEAKKAP